MKRTLLRKSSGTRLSMAEAYSDSRSLTSVPPLALIARLMSAFAAESLEISVATLISNLLQQVFQPDQSLPQFLQNILHITTVEISSGIGNDDVCGSIEDEFYP